MENKDRIPLLTIMVGLPRSGKSTWIKKNKKDDIVVSPDEIRKEIFGHQFHAPANPFIFAISGAMTSLLLKQGKDVIVDATHITHQLRFSWYPVIKQYGCKTRLVFVHIEETMDKNLTKIIERNNLSPENERLPEDVLRKFAISFEPLDERDYSLFDEIISFKNV